MNFKQKDDRFSKEVLEAFLQNCVVVLHVDDESSFTFIHFAAAFIQSILQINKISRKRHQRGGIKHKNRLERVIKTRPY